MESQPQNPKFKNNPENTRPCTLAVNQDFGYYDFELQSAWQNNKPWRSCEDLAQTTPSYILQET